MFRLRKARFLLDCSRAREHGKLDLTSLYKGVLRILSHPSEHRFNDVTACLSFIPSLALSRLALSRVRASKQSRTMQGPQSHAHTKSPHSRKHTEAGGASQVKSQGSHHLQTRKTRGRASHHPPSDNLSSTWISLFYPRAFWRSDHSLESQLSSWLALHNASNKV